MIIDEYNKHTKQCNGRGYVIVIAQVPGIYDSKPSDCSFSVVLLFGLDHHRTSLSAAELLSVTQKLAVQQSYGHFHDFDELLNSID